MYNPLQVVQISTLVPPPYRPVSLVTSHTVQADGCTSSRRQGPIDGVWVWSSDNTPSATGQGKWHENSTRTVRLSGGGGAHASGTCTRTPYCRPG